MFKKKLYSKAEENNIKVDFQEESYTSKCSFLDKEELKHHETYLGKRVKRGLFQTYNGKKLNADVNGASNIALKYLERNVSTEGKKSIIDTFYTGVCMGFMNNPVRIKVI